MDFDTAVSTIHALLEKEQPKTFSSSWIFARTPTVYNFIRVNYRTENDLVDWDRLTYALHPEYAKRWIRYKRRPAKSYKDQHEVDRILSKYKDKLYTFVIAIDPKDIDIRNKIIIALVRTSQRGNVLASEELVIWLRYIVDDWIEKYYQLFKWKGYGEAIDKKIRSCIRCYKYTGSFVGYLFKTLEYSARGMRPLQAWSLDDPVGSDGASKIDFMVQDAETGIVEVFGR